MMESPDITPKNFLRFVRYAFLQNGHTWWFVRLTPLPPAEQEYTPEKLKDSSLLHYNLRLGFQRGMLSRAPWFGLEQLWRGVKRFCDESRKALYFMRPPKR